MEHSAIDKQHRSFKELHQLSNFKWKILQLSTKLDMV
uniref:Uncharacterized protein n=1 Tax=Rhizophora mucronata TaxID=61149 RepID=A0A2P2R512_RHIMU